MTCYKSKIVTKTSNFPNGGDWYIEDDAEIVRMVRESFEQYAANEGLDMLDFRDLGVIPPEDINIVPGVDFDKYAYTWRGFEADFQRTICIED
ncbi:hypothetical protein SEA_AGEOFDAPAGE_26 [Mycobacterium phage Ageofdapage]|nr:hypothetical protein SEA_AGEOFDAPAGE_26 [Mycobacterium phage Ageofdapage]